jgi:hypothetical protein
MKRSKTGVLNILGVLCFLLGIAVRLSAAGVPATQAQAADKILERNRGGYLMVAQSQAPASFNVGFSFYTAAWPLVEKYQGHRFQSGLYGTWMHPQYDGPAPKELYSDIEGGLGWWRDTCFPTETPKFIMGGVGPNFSEIANGPAHGWVDGGLYGVAQLSPWLLFPIDGLNVRQGACGQLFGSGYLALPLTPAKATTDGANVPTGDHCWTLFLSTKNFKGPVVFFTPYFWSHATAKKPEWAGKLLDSRPGHPNKPMSMKTQYVPAAVFEGAKGESYLRTASTLFPVDADGNSVLVHRVTVYNKDALWNDVKRWFDGGAAASGSINPQGAVVQKVNDGCAGWKIWPPKPGEEPVPLAWRTFATPFTPDPLTFGYRWNDHLVTRTKTANGSLVRLPEYLHLTANANQKPEWTPADLRPADHGDCLVAWPGGRSSGTGRFLGPGSAGSYHSRLHGDGAAGHLPAGAQGGHASPIRSDQRLLLHRPVLQRAEGCREGEGSVRGRARIESRSARQ